MKYYLLTFNDDWADEHIVPALACFNKDQYDEWLERPSGKLNPKYEEYKKAKEEYDKKWAIFWKDLEKKGYTLNGSANTNKIPKDDYATLALEVAVRRLPRPKDVHKVNSFINAYLGNSGEGFSESYSDKYLMKEFVEDNTVQVLEVDESFYNTFHKACLYSLSLCNIFDEDIADYQYEEEDDE